VGPFTLIFEGCLGLMMNSLRYLPLTEGSTVDCAMTYSVTKLIAVAYFERAFELGRSGLGCLIQGWSSLVLKARSMVIFNKVKSVSAPKTSKDSEKSPVGSTSSSHLVPSYEPSSEEQTVASPSTLHSPTWKVDSSSPASPPPAVCTSRHET